MEEQSVINFEKKAASSVYKALDNKINAIVSGLFENSTKNLIYPLEELSEANLSEYISDFLRMEENEFKEIELNGNYIRIKYKKKFINLFVNIVKDKNKSNSNFVMVRNTQNSYKNISNENSSNVINANLILEFLVSEKDNFYNRISLSSIPNSKLRNIYKPQDILDDECPIEYTYFDMNKLVDINKEVWRYQILYTRDNEFENCEDINIAKQIEKIELKYLKKYYHFLKFAEDEMLSGFQTKESIKNDWQGYYKTEISDFAVGAIANSICTFKWKGNWSTQFMSSRIRFIF